MPYSCPLIKHFPKDDPFLIPLLYGEYFICMLLKLDVLFVSIKFHPHVKEAISFLVMVKGCNSKISINLKEISNYQIS